MSSDETRIAIAPSAQETPVTDSIAAKSGKDHSAAFRVKIKKIRVDRPDRQDACEDEQSQTGTTEFEQIGKQYVTQLRMLRGYIKEVERIASLSDAQNEANCLRLFADIKIASVSHEGRSERPLAILNAEIATKDTDGKEVIHKYAEKVYDYKFLRKANDFAQSMTAARRILYATSLQHIVNALEQLIADLFVCYTDRHPGSLRSQATLTYQEVLSATTLDDLKRSIALRESRSFLQMSSEDQFSEMDKKLKGSLRDSFRGLDELIEVCLRRHCYVHSNGLASHEYVSRSKKLRIDTPVANAGSPLELSRQYIDRAWALAYVGGCILTELWWKASIANDENYLENTTNAERFINEVGYDSILHDDIQAATDLFRYAVGTRKNHEMSMMANLNLAQCLKRFADANAKNDQRAKVEKEIVDIVKESKWSGASVAYRLGAAALREDAVEFQSLLPLAVADTESISHSCFYEWPIFQWMRRRGDYSDWISTAYGRKPSELGSAIRFSVLGSEPVPIQFSIDPNWFDPPLFSKDLQASRQSAVSDL